MNVMTQVHPFLDGKTKRMLIGGKWLEAVSGKTFETRNPATGEILAHVAEGDAEDIDRAVAAAREAFNGPWSKFKPAQRQAILLKLADLVERDIEEFAALDTLDMGAPITRTRANKARAIGMLRFYAGMATALHGETINNSLPGEIVSFTLKEPVGVVGAIIPWNGALTASIWKIGPALATGCTVVLKPAEEAPLTPLRLGELCLEAGVPPGVVNVVPGFGETAGAALASHPDVDKVAFTGSHLTGSRSFGHRPETSSGYRWNWAASRRTSCSPMLIWHRRYQVPGWRCLPTRVRSAAPARGCSSRRKSTRNSWVGLPTSAKRCASVMAGTRKPRSARWCRRSR
jgi:hypothetical protein